MTFRERLRYARKLRGLGARELDRKASLTEGHTSHLERREPGRVAPDTVMKLAEALGVPPLWLGYGEGPKPAARR